MQTKMIDLKKINLEGNTQCRAEISEPYVDELVEHLEAGKELPPVILFPEGEVYWPGDGYHRILAYKKAGRSKIPAEVQTGTQRDALLFAAGANANHGLRRSNADKRRAVEMLLADPEWTARSDGWIAQKCSVSQPFVSKVRASVTQNVLSQNRTGKDGRSINTEGIGRISSPQTPAISNPYDQHPDPDLCFSCNRARRVGQPLPEHCQACRDLHKIEKEVSSSNGTPRPAPSAEEQLRSDIEAARTEEEELYEPTPEEQWKAANSRLEAFCRGLMRYVEENLPRDDPWLKRNDRDQSAIKSFEAGCATVRSAKRFATCPSCGGPGCEDCRGTGGVPKAIYDQIAK